MKFTWHEYFNSKLCERKDGEAVGDCGNLTAEWLVTFSKAQQSTEESEPALQSVTARLVMIDQVSSQEETKVCVLSPKFWVGLALVNHLNQQRTPETLLDTERERCFTL